MSQGKGSGTPVDSSNLKDSRISNINFGGGITVTLVELDQHFARDGGECVELAFSQCSPKLLFVDSLRTPEGQLAITKAAERDLPFIDLSLPAFNSVVGAKAGITPRGYIKLILGPKMLIQGTDILAAMKEQSISLNLHPGLLHALVAEFNIEIVTDRDGFSVECGQIGEFLIRATMDLNWHRFRAYALKFRGDLLAVSAIPFSQIFSPDYKPSFGYDDKELALYETEQLKYYDVMQNRTELPSREESLIRLLTPGVVEIGLPQMIAELRENPTSKQKALEGYEINMQSQEYLNAALIARALFEVEGDENSKKFLQESLSQVYGVFIDQKLLALAGLVAEAMHDYGIEEGGELLKSAQKGYWNLLNRNR